MNPPAKEHIPLEPKIRTEDPPTPEPAANMTEIEVEMPVSESEIPDSQASSLGAFRRSQSSSESLIHHHEQGGFAPQLDAQDLLPYAPPKHLYRGDIQNTAQSIRQLRELERKIDQKNCFVQINRIMIATGTLLASFLVLALLRGWYHYGPFSGNPRYEPKRFHENPSEMNNVTANASDNAFANRFGNNTFANRFGNNASNQGALHRNQNFYNNSAKFGHNEYQKDAQTTNSELIAFLICALIIFIAFMCYFHHKGIKAYAERKADSMFWQFIGCAVLCTLHAVVMDFIGIGVYIYLGYTAYSLKEIFTKMEELKKQMHVEGVYVSEDQGIESYQEIQLAIM